MLIRHRYHWLFLLGSLLTLLSLFWFLTSQTRANLVRPAQAINATLPIKTLISMTDISTTVVAMPVSSTSYLPIVSAPQWFHFPIIAAPLPLVSPYPPSGAVEQSPNAFLQWETRQTAPAFVSYAIYLEANNPQPSVLIAQGVAKTSFDPQTFVPGAQYYWQVLATDELGRQIAGPVWTFTVEPRHDPPLLGARIPIPAGEFLMGCDPKRSPAGGCVVGKNTPLHPVYLDDYAIDKYEVTNLQYRTCVNAQGCRPPLYSTSQTRNTYFTDPAYDTYPVVFVAQEDARTYCQWAGGRLPTEAEWEKAARGPIDTRTWPWGEESPDCSRANYTDDRGRNWVTCVGDTAQVGSYPAGASPYGVMDMSGNVFEWVMDRLDILYKIHYYAISPYANPPGPQPRQEIREGPFYVIRGGSYRPRWSYARVFHRHHGHRGGYSDLGVDVPLYRNDQVGFRCVYSE